MKKIFFVLIVYNVLLSICFSQGTWTQKANFPGTARFDAMSFSIGMKGYIIAGSGGGALQDFWEYDAINNIWQQKANFPGNAREQGVSFSIGAKGYLGTGIGTLYQNDFWEYDTLFDSWTQKANLGIIGRYSAIGFSIGTKGYIGCGINNNGNYLGDFWEWDKSTNAWTQKANISSPRAITTSFSIGGKGYFGTGADSLGNCLADFWEYDVALNTWIQKSNFPAGGRRDIDDGIFSVGNYEYVGTGVDINYNYFNDFWKYNPIADTWISIPSLPGVARMGASNFLINNRGYIGLGMVSSGSLLNDLWEYTDTTSGEGVNEVVNKNRAVLGDAQPNPNSGSTQIPYYIPENTNGAKIIFTDLLGRIMEEKQLQAGYGLMKIDTRDLPSGVYSYSIVINDRVVDTKKMMKSK